MIPSERMSEGRDEIAVGVLCQALQGRGHPIPQGDRHRHDPLAGGESGNDLLDEVSGGLGHAPPGTGGTKPPPPLAAEG